MADRGEDGMAVMGIGHHPNHRASREVVGPHCLPYRLVGQAE